MFQRSELVYKDYKWSAKADHDNPKQIGGTDHTELNRTEGYEMLYFIKSLAKTWWPNGYDVASAQKIEKTVRTKVPGSVRTHSGIKKWIEDNHKQFWDRI